MDNGDQGTFRLNLHLQSALCERVIPLSNCGYSVERKRTGWSSRMSTMAVELDFLIKCYLPKFSIHQWTVLSTIQLPDEAELLQDRLVEFAKTSGMELDLVEKIKSMSPVELVVTAEVLRWLKDTTDDQDPFGRLGIPK